LRHEEELYPWSWIFDRGRAFLMRFAHGATIRRE
jgi:hypothetical protein